MLCVFLENLPQARGWDPEACDRLHRELAEAAGCAPDAVEVYASNITYGLLGRDGREYLHGVHVNVVGDGGAEAKIAAAIHLFLAFHGMSAGTDIIFHRGPSRIDGNLEAEIAQLGMDEVSADLLRYLVRTWREGHASGAAWAQLADVIQHSHSGVWFAFCGYRAGWRSAGGGD